MEPMDGSSPTDSEPDTVGQPDTEPAPQAQAAAGVKLTSMFSHPVAASAGAAGQRDSGGEQEGQGVEQAPVAVAGGFGLLFKAPDLSEVIARPRRRSVPEPVGEEDESQDGQQGQDGDGRSRSRSGERRSRAASGTEDTDTDADTDIDADANEADGSDDEEDPSDGGRRRRRRGGKGRRARGGEAQDQEAGDGEDGQQQDTGDRASSAAPEDDTGRDNGAPAGGGRDAGKGAAGGTSAGGGRRQPKATEDADSAGADQAEEEGGTKRRRRRRRGGEEPERSARDEVSGVKGSTRLEAKRQRRRDGREAGRRRTIVTEAEFLARRESVERVMVVRGLEERTQIGVLEDGVLVEHYVSKETQTTMAGNVYLGRVQNVLPSMEAAFVDIGKGRNAVLYAGEVNWDAAGLDNAPKRIENALKAGESVLVQVTKDPIGHKGARLTSQISLPGRYLVYVPNNSMTGISRKLPDTERTRLKKILKEVVPADAGVIVRTAAEGASEAELRADVERLTAMWERIQAKQGSATAPALLHGEADMTVRVIRDVFNEDFAKVVVAGDKAWTEVSDYLGSVAPDLADRLERWTGSDDAFTHFRVTESLAKAMDRKVWLPSGGSLVIDRTEAMTVVDVNTGKFVGSGGNLEETVTKNNIEAAEEIVRQLRLRDIGGIIVIDFIDMVLESNRDLVVRRLLECLGRDRTKHQVAEVTSLGLVQMTRKRVGAGLIEVFSEPCSHCVGRGLVVHSEPVERSSGDEGGGDNGGRGGRGRRSRGAGQAGGGLGRGEGTGAETRNVLPTPNPNGPTPAQIAAAAHAAALQAASVTEAADAAARAAAEELRPEEPVPAQTAGREQPAEEPPVEQPPVRPAPRRARRATAAVATTPVVVEPDAALPTVPQPVEPAGAAGAPEAEAPDVPEAPMPESAASPPAARRRRGRVVAPAGPPAGGGDGATG